jgi:hypothetical protein
MRQCKLSKFGMKSGTIYTTAWLPEKHCKKGHFVELVNDDDEIVIGWMVEDVGTIRKKQSEVDDRGQDYKRTRKASDI